jgi:hypothetical protein
VVDARLRWIAGTDTTGKAVFEVVVIVKKDSFTG